MKWVLLECKDKQRSASFSRGVAVDTFVPIIDTRYNILTYLFHVHNNAPGWVYKKGTLWLQQELLTFCFM